MGQNSSQQQNEYSEILKNYEIVLKNQQGTILKHKITQQRFILKQTTFMDQEQYSKSLDLYKLRKINVKQNVLNLIETEGRSKTNFCSGSYKIYLIYEFPNITLYDQIVARSQQKRYFQQQDIWSITESCLNGLSQNSYKIFLDPKKIFIMSDGLIKIIDQNILTDGYKYMLTEGIYYAPERFQNFSKIQKGQNEEKQIVFSVGMSILHAGILENCLDCYDVRSQRFLTQILEQKISRFGQKYSNDLSLIVRNMLEINPENRLSVNEVQKLICLSTEDEGPMERMTTIQNEVNAIQKQPTQKVLGEKNPNIYTRDQYFPKQYQITNKMTFSAINDLKINSNVKQNIVNNNVQEQSKETSRLPQNLYRESLGYSVNNNLALTSSNIAPTSFNPSYTYQPYKYIAPVSLSYFPTNISYQNTQNLFTDPKLIEMMRKDLSQINARKTYSTMNYQNSYYQPYQTIPIVEPNIKVPVVVNQIENNQKKQEQEHAIQIMQSDGRIYQGNIVNNLKQGKGKLIYPDGAYYEGNFKNNLMDGFGTLYYGENKLAYQGEWKQDKFHGKGKLYNQNPIDLANTFDFSDFNLVEDYWIYYEGEFKDDNKFGLGKLYLTNGQYFDGQFSNDTMTGKGKFFDNSKNMHEGVWENNKLIELITQ